MTKSCGILTSTRNGSASMEADDSTVSARALKATVQPEKRDMAQPWMPRSRYSCTLHGYKTGIIEAENKWSDWCGRVEEYAPWSSPATSSTPPSFDVPAWFMCLKTSPQRSTPGPLPYHMANTPSYLAGPIRSTCCEPQTAVAAKSSLTPGTNCTWCASSCFLAFHRFSSRPPRGEPR